MAVTLPLEGGPPVFGSSGPTTDAYPTSGGVFTVRDGMDPQPDAPECPCDMVSIATTSTDMSKMPRHEHSGVPALPENNLNQPY